MRPRQPLELIVGAFVVVGMALLIFFIFVIGDVASVLQPTYRLRVFFDSANGITRGSPVQYAGVEVGKVQEVAIDYPGNHSAPRVRLTVRLPTAVAVRSDDVASISTFGLLGEKYLQITPGPGEGPVLAPDSELIGKSPVSTERLIERSNEVLTAFKQTLEGINSLVADPTASIYLKEAVQEARDATRNWKVLGERLNLAMSYTESGQGSLGRLLFDDELYEQVVLLVEDLRQHPWKLLTRPRTTDRQPPRRN
jgi:phospholipid/cholesterol/gamma-HCH transport system substrate-binding protein